MHETTDIKETESIENTERNEELYKNVCNLVLEYNAWDNWHQRNWINRGFKYL